MAGDKCSEERREWLNARRRLQRAYEEKEISGFVERIEIRRDMLRKYKCLIETDTGYWHCGAMTYICEFCSALHYLGEMRIKFGSTFANPKFSDCCSSGQVTPHFPYLHHACNVLRYFEIMKA